MCMVDMVILGCWDIPLGCFVYACACGKGLKVRVRFSFIWMCD